MGKTFHDQWEPSPPDAHQMFVGKENKSLDPTSECSLSVVGKNPHNGKKRSYRYGSKYLLRRYFSPQIVPFVHSEQLLGFIRYFHPRNPRPMFPVPMLLRWLNESSQLWDPNPSCDCTVACSATPQSMASELSPHSQAARINEVYLGDHPIS